MFGAPARRLFGMLHDSSASARRGHAVVVCGPFGREAIRVHRLLRVVADRLAREGVPVLRFDYYGSGESEGSDQDADLDGWATDIVAAGREIRERTGLRRVTCLGVRLGATAAARAFSNVDASDTGYVFWDPVCDGERYLRSLAERHEQSAAKAFSIPPRSQRRPASTVVGREALGFALPAHFVDQLRRVSIAEMGSGMSRRRATVIYDRGTADGQGFLGYLESSPAWVEPIAVEHGMDWLSSAAENVALVPAPAVSGLTRSLLEWR
ncbi:MAG: alpha/beta hydrolase [Steroidobacteraceae bacterium]